MKPRFLAVCSLSLVLLASSCLINPAPAQTLDPYFSAGISFFKKGDYKKALQYFVAVCTKNPYDSEAMYYEALCYQHIGDTKNATKLYATLVSNYSYTTAGKMAASVLSRMDPGYYKQLTTRQTSRPAAAQSASSPQIFIPNSSSTSSSADLASLPNEARVYCEHENFGYMVDATVNGRAIKMVFDTGAEGCVFGMNHLQQMGIKSPTGAPIGMSSGVGSSGGIPIWAMDVDLKVGSIERKNFRIMIHQSLPTPPLLGETFFKDFMITMDSTASSPNIHFVKKLARVANVAGDRNAVPFRRHGTDIIVDAEVNGHPMTMFYDTGATGIAFTNEQIRKAGLTIPEDAVPITSTGIGGSTTGMSFTVPKIKLGPIEKTNVQVTTTDNASMPYPLLGASFFADWEATVDPSNNVIRLLRR